MSHFFKLFTFVLSSLTISQCLAVIGLSSWGQTSIKSCSDSILNWYVKCLILLILSHSLNLLQTMEHCSQWFTQLSWCWQPISVNFSIININCTVTLLVVSLYGIMSWFWQTFHNFVSPRETQLFFTAVAEKGLGVSWECKAIS